MAWGGCYGVPTSQVIPTMSTPTFPTAEAATAWMLAHLEDQGEECIDNERFTFLDDEKGLAEYDRLAQSGCCGAFDQDIVVADRPARVGCNHGH